MNIPRKAFLFVLTTGCMLLLCGRLPAQGIKNSDTFTVVLDPGHGGKDPGAVYAGVKEKDVNLAVALKLGKLISDNYPDVKVIYTRRTDVFIGLDERGVIANKAGANLFISLHADAASRTSANGAATFIMGMNKTENNLREAMRENAVMKYEDDYSEKYEGFDPTSAESYIIFNLIQYAYFDRSLQLANLIQKKYSQHTGFYDRGAKQGPFYVLWKPAMPSVLTEMGFVSNETDRKYMTSEKGQNEIAKSLFEAFSEYIAAVDRKSAAAADDTGGASPVPQKETAQTESEPTASKPERTQNAQKPAERGSAVGGPYSDGAGYYVQICASRVKIPLNDPRFRNLPAKPVEKQIDGWYKYAIGGYSTLEQAQNVQAEVKRGAFREAFLTAFDGNEQIGLNEAKRRIAEQNKK